MANFISVGKDQKIQKTKKKHKKIKIIALVVAVIFVILISLLFLSIKPAFTTYYTALNGKEALLRAQNSIQQQKFSAATKALKYANEDFQSASNSLKKLAWLRIIPFANIQYKAADHLLRCGIQLSSSLRTITETAEDIVKPIQYKEVKSFSNITAEQKRELLKNLYQSTPSFEKALSGIKLAEIEANKIPSGGVIGKLEEVSTEISAKLPQIKQILEKVILASRLLPGIAGYPKEQTYLFLLQNNTELRPTGGFLGTYGILKVKDGELVELKTDDTYNLDNNSNISVKPPWQLPKLVNPNMKSWYLRDSNWSPDFPTSAQKAEWFYHQEGGTENFDGVIAITPTFIEYLLEITGPIKISNFPREFTSKNIVDMIQYHVEQRFAEIGLTVGHRKNLIGELAQAVIKKLFSLPKDKWTELALTLQKALLEKHFLVYFHNSEVQEFLEKENWSGKIESKENQDYLFIVDANMASLKTDQYVDRIFKYKLDLTKDQAEAELKLTYKNNAPGFSWKTTRYRNWNRIYIPKNSQLIAVEGNEKNPSYYGNLKKDYEIIEEFDKLSVGTFISIEPGQQKTLTYRYKLPKDLTETLKKNYSLFIQKQPGTIEPKLSVIIQVPNKIKSFSPTDSGKIANQQIEFNTDLRTDREFLINF